MGQPAALKQESTLNPDYLPLVAEVAVALAGFGSLAGLIGRRGSSESPEVDAGRLRGMLERALAVAVLALLPMALGQFPVPDPVVWRTCAAVAFVASPAMNWSLIYRLRQLPNYAPGAAYFVSSQVTLALQLSLLTAGFLDVVPLASAYGLALLMELCTTGGMFLRVVASITSARSPAA